MAADVLTCNVRQEGLISVWLAIEHKADLAGLNAPAESPGPEEETELERHVKARQT